ncbi:hypothetical protein JOC77_002093 [Peribacillus deserti]|uniref:YpfB family protein n=1 Tax=Peribacillus deserti TaxID=673318 RepID=A0ABS2QJH8_9BACI|nr:DUF5359 family protein [Peribacillus deserti]MBM7692663.1 hypothetical protein [Peribacillus deserti]
MKRFEEILIKLIMIQFVFLLFFQVFFHREDSFLELKKMAKYEGVNENNYGKVLDALNQWKFRE